MAKAKQTVPPSASPVTLSPDQIIELMNIYLSEWIHRDQLMWTQVFKLFYAALIVTILPNAASYIGISFPGINIKVFPIIGIVMAFVFLYIGLGYACRLRASSRTYENMMHLLGNNAYERISICDRTKMKWGFLFAKPLANILVVTMFIALMAVSMLMLLV